MLAVGPGGRAHRGPALNHRRHPAQAQGCNTSGRGGRTPPADACWDAIRCDRRIEIRRSLGWPWGWRPGRHHSGSKYNSLRQPSTRTGGVAPTVSGVGIVSGRIGVPAPFVQNRRDPNTPMQDNPAPYSKIVDQISWFKKRPALPVRHGRPPMSATSADE